MIYINLYKSSEKKEIFKIIESGETSTGEYIFIDVIMPKSLFIDYSLIESILTPEQLKTNLPEIIYDYINEDYSENINESRKYFTDFDLKIQKLLDLHIIVPIVDDFLLYHKDNEKYEKDISKIDSIKKKDETKIKYIVNKINTAYDYYKNPNEIKKLFYGPLLDRNAILVNTCEDIKIISKVSNIIKMNNENLDLLNDLLNYKLYPYISFKEFEKNGFVFNSESSIDAIRYISIKDIKNKKFNILETRIISEKMLVNITGFAIINTSDPIDCLNTNSFINISDETTNPLPVFKSLLENKIKNKYFSHLKDNEILTKNYYWLFDLEKQKYFVPHYDISPNMNKNDVVKILSAYLYDCVIEIAINLLKKNIESLNQKFITEYINKLNFYIKKLPDIINPQYSNGINELEYLIYYKKSKKIEDTYDYAEDDFPGLYGNVIKLPNTFENSKVIIPIIKLNSDFKITDEKNDLIINNKIKEELKKELIKDIDTDLIEFEKNEYVRGICQHNVSWDKIGELKKHNDVRYPNLVYEFIQQYVIMNPTMDFICKSCKSSINIKKYILDGKFDTNTQSYITFSIQLDNVLLEDIDEYEKYKTSIRSLDKIIDRISSIINMQGLSGSSYQTKIKRKNIIKDVLDIVLIHNNYLKKSYYQNNRNKFIQQFGIVGLSNLYIFTLDNTVFVYSSKDKDIYKSAKYNNIISYILIILILEINETQIQSLTNDKNMCNYFIYKKIGYTLFDNINIIINKSQDVEPIKNYPILCYLIYIFSAFITKYNIWADTLSTNANIIEKKKDFILIQKSIICTIIEILNTILLVDSEKQKNYKIYLYDILQTKYYYKKKETYADYNLIKKLDKMYLSDGLNKQRTQYTTNTKKFDIEPNNNIYNLFVEDDLYKIFSKKYCIDRFIAPYYKNNFKESKVISNLTNCISGEFHDFKTSGKKLVCAKCKEIANIDNLIPDSIKLIGDRYNILYLRKLGTKYCPNGLMHLFVYSSEFKQDICKNCKYVKNSLVKYTDKELFNLYNTIELNILNNNLKTINLIKNIKDITEGNISETTKLFSKIIYKYEKYNNNINNTIDTLLEIIHKLLGIDIVINNETYNLYHNIYIIDHDNNGILQETPVYIYENENKFRIIENHNHYKKNVIIYTMKKKNTKYEVFYDLDEKILLGYREINKEYINITKNNVKLRINYSFKNMIILFGFTRKKINIKDFYPELYGYTQDKINSIYNDFDMFNLINKIAYRRFNIIKKLGMELKKYMNRFKNNYKINLITIEVANPYQNQNIPTVYTSDTANSILDLLFIKYKKKIEKNIIVESTKIKEEKKNNKSEDLNSIYIFLKYMNIINLYLQFDKIKLSKNDIPKFNEFIDFEIIFKNDFISNITLNYIIDEIIKFINYNTNKNTKTNILHFITELICILFKSTFFEISKFNHNLNYFYQVLYTSEFYLETQTNEFMYDALDYHSDQESSKNIDNLDEEDQDKVLDQIEDNNEEFEGVDIDNMIDEGDGDYEIDDIEGVYNLYNE
jgi:hypothetical protein